MAIQALWQAACRTKTLTHRFQKLYASEGVECCALLCSSCKQKLLPLGAAMCDRAMQAPLLQSGNSGHASAIDVGTTASCSNSWGPSSKKAMGASLLRCRSNVPADLR